MTRKVQYEHVQVPSLSHREVHARTNYLIMHTHPEQRLGSFAR